LQSSALSDIHAEELIDVASSTSVDAKTVAADGSYTSSRGLTSPSLAQHQAMASGMARSCSAAARRLKQATPYDKAWEGDPVVQHAPQAVADKVIKLASDHDLDAETALA